MIETVVIGLGNALFTDEGVGIHLLHELEKHAARLPSVAFCEIGTAGMRALHAMEDAQKAFFLDCALMGEEPGTIRRFTPESARSIKGLRGFSLHEGDLFQILDLARSLGQCPAEVSIYGIQPASTEPGERLSPLLAGKRDDYVKIVLKELKGSV